MWPDEIARGFGKSIGAMIAYVTIAMIVWLVSVGAFMAILHAYF